MVLSISTGSTEKEISEYNNLTDALQENILLFLSDLSFCESLLPEQLITKECISEEDCAYIRSLSNRTDKIRTLIRMIKRRDRKTILNFLDIVGDDNPHLKKKVHESFNHKQNLENKSDRPTCTTCMMVKIVDLKDIIDTLWKEKLISDDLYDVAIADAEHHRDIIWNSILHSLNKKSNSSQCISVLVNALENKYGHIANLLKEETNLDKLQCCCLRRSNQYRKRLPNMSSSTQSSLTNVSVSRVPRTIDLLKQTSLDDSDSDQHRRHKVGKSGKKKGRIESDETESETENESTMDHVRDMIESSEKQIDVGESDNKKIDTKIVIKKEPSDRKDDRLLSARRDNNNAPVGIVDPEVRQVIERNRQVIERNRQVIDYMRFPHGPGLVGTMASPLQGMKDMTMGKIPDHGGFSPPKMPPGYQNRGHSEGFRQPNYPGNSPQQGPYDHPQQTFHQGVPYRPYPHSDDQGLDDSDSDQHRRHKVGKSDKKKGRIESDETESETENESTMDHVRDMVESSEKQIDVAESDNKKIDTEIVIKKEPSDRKDDRLLSARRDNNNAPVGIVNPEVRPDVIERNRQVIDSIPAAGQYMSPNITTGPQGFHPGYFRASIEGPQIPPSGYGGYGPGAPIGGPKYPQQGPFSRGFHFPTGLYQGQMLGPYPEPPGQQPGPLAQMNYPPNMPSGYPQIPQPRPPHPGGMHYPRSVCALR